MTYTEITEAAKAYADRKDLEVTDNMDIFILMAESRINRVLKIQEQTHRVYTGSIEGLEFYTLPPDYNGMRSIHFNTGGVDVANSKPVPVHYATPEYINTLQSDSIIEDKYYYTITSGQLQLQKPLPGGGTIEMVFYCKVPHLTKSEASNWLSNDHPDIYLSGLICEIELFVKNHEVAKLWDDKMSRSIGELQTVDVENRWTGTQLQIRVE